MKGKLSREREQQGSLSVRGSGDKRETNAVIRTISKLEHKEAGDAARAGPYAVFSFTAAFRRSQTDFASPSSIWQLGL